MRNPFVSRIGGVLSADIAVPDHERASRFYSRVLSTGEEPLWREDLMNKRGMPIIGLGARGTEYDQLPLQWIPHVQVADVGASVEQASALDGMVLMQGKDDAGVSQWAVLRDPNGAAFGLIPVVPPQMLAPAEGHATESVGRIAWLDLTVPDASATRDFYRQVVGWTVEEVRMEDAGEEYADYSMLGADGSPAAGVCHARGVNRGLPPCWLLYLPVGDLAESLRRAAALGGEVVRAMHGADGACIYAVVRDPVGAWVALVPG